MRRLLSVLFSILICTLQFLSAQVISRNMPYVTSTVVVKVLDSTSRKPISYASVFLVPQKDSIISHFTLSDTTGVARINEVTKGEYLLNIQMMGYKPIQKSFYARRYIEDLGKFYLAIDEKMLKAATVTATESITKIKVTQAEGAIYTSTTPDKINIGIASGDSVEITPKNTYKAEELTITWLDMSTETTRTGNQLISEHGIKLPETGT